MLAGQWRELGDLGREALHAPRDVLGPIPTPTGEQRTRPGFGFGGHEQNCKPAAHGYATASAQKRRDPYACACVMRILTTHVKLVDVTERLTKLGVLIEHARAELRISAREAARRAGISPTRWRQVVTGSQVKGGRAVPVNPTPRTVVAMALAVLVAPADALVAAGLAVPSNLGLLIDDLRGEVQGREVAAPAPVVNLSADEHRRLTAEIARIEGMRLPEATKLTMLEALIRAWERYAVERDASSASA